jgi:CDP-diglyceride synthetase
MPSGLFYYIDAQGLAVGLFLVLIAALASGYWLGRRTRANTDETAKSQSSTIQGAIIGVLALLLAFTLSMAITRFETRRQLVLDEANAIGTTYLRSKMLPAPYAAQAAAVLRQYVDNRLEFYNAGIDETRFNAANDQVGQLQNRLWAIATAASAQDNRAIPTGLFVQALNDTIDLQAKRLAAARNTVPETVILLLFAVAAATAAVVGYNSGLSNQRRVFAALMLVFLITLIIWVLIDLDRPRRGLILVSQQSMIDLQQTIKQDLP